MERLQRIITGIVVLVVSGTILNTAAAAQAAARYPERPIRLIVPYPPGGTADVLARIIGVKLGEKWNRTVVVDNRGGAGGNIATEMAARAEADGYTLLLCNAPVLAINPTLYKKVSFDPVKDFAPVGPIAEVPLFLVVHPSLPAKNSPRMCNMRLRVFTPSSAGSMRKIPRRTSNLRQEKSPFTTRRAGVVFGSIRTPTLGTLFRRFTNR